MKREPFTCTAARPPRHLRPDSPRIHPLRSPAAHYSAGDGPRSPRPPRSNAVPIFRRSDPRTRRRGLPMGRLVIAGIIAAISLIAYYGRSSVNPVTGQKQRVALSVDQEIALGLQSAPEMAHQFGGLDPDPRRQATVDQVGQRLVAAI